MDFDITEYLAFAEKCFYPEKFTLKEIEGGLSDDIKLKADLDGQSYIVKIVEGKSKNTPYGENRIIFYRALCTANESDKRIICPGWFDYIGGRVVTVTEWVRGISLEEYLCKNPDEQIKYGKEVGKLLYKLHNFGFVKRGIQNSNEKFAPKIIKKTEELLETVGRLNISFSGIEKVKEYLRNNESLVSEERAGILHNDIRLENFIINDGKIFLFDFDSGTVGDAYAEFTYLTALAEKDFRVFAYAVVMSYFDGKVPEDFWKTNLYFCMIKLLEYAVYKFNKSGKAVVNQANSCLKIFNGYEKAVPDWWDKTDGKLRKFFTEETGK